MIFNSIRIEDLLFYNMKFEKTIYSVSCYLSLRNGLTLLLGQVPED